MPRKSYRTPDELVQIYTSSQEGRTGKQIAEQLNINYYSVLVALHLLNKYLTGRLPPHVKRSTNYTVAAKLIRKQRAAFHKEEPSIHPKPTLSPTSDSFAFLKASFDAFQQGVASFIEMEPGRRYSALQRENQALREENEQLRQRQPQTTSWIDALQASLPEEDI